MASPRPAGASALSTQPLTPPAEAPAPNNPAPANFSANATAGPTTALPSPPQFPATSLQDSGKSRRPRDARLIHMLLASMGVTAYQERVPLQLLDFAYRYTSSTLQDAVYLATEGYSGETTTQRGAAKEINISLNSLRLSIASRLHYQFQPGLPKEFLIDVAAERNRILLPGVSRGGDVSASAAANAASAGPMVGGVRLPPDRFCLTGVAWDLREEWESEREDEMEVDSGGQQNAEGGGGGGEEDEDVDGTMEDVFGEDRQNGQDEDQEMGGA